MSHHSNPHTIESALKNLEDGNARFVAGRPAHPHGDVSTRSRLDVHGQTPLAAVLACSDSRAPVELLFDQGFGDVFVIRAAGQVAGVDQIGSLEYAVAHLGVPLILVLGHTKCGAVTAALAKAQEPGALGQLLSRLDAVVKEVENLPDDQRLNVAVEKAVDHIQKELREKSAVLALAEKEGRLKIAGAVYHLESGRVEFRP
ncbi:MAG: carbonic anhydrase [Candidatus Adiutrix sp.]|jgi:carbonic anhydrase|nr:carbonic anhydrase [Candidatus Adiutrix sp.]